MAFRIIMARATEISSYFAGSVPTRRAAIGATRVPK